MDVDAWWNWKDNEQSAQGSNETAVAAKNDKHEQKPKVELPLPLWQQAYGQKVKKEHLFKKEVKNEQLFKAKVDLAIGIPDSSTRDLQTAVAAEPRTARKVHKWNKPTRDLFVDLAKKISANYEVSLSDEDVDFGSAGSARGNVVESNVSDDGTQSQGADSADSIETFASCGVSPCPRASPSQASSIVFSEPCSVC